MKKLLGLLTLFAIAAVVLGQTSQPGERIKLAAGIVNFYVDPAIGSDNNDCRIFNSASRTCATLINTMLKVLNNYDCNALNQTQVRINLADNLTASSFTSTDTVGVHWPPHGGCPGAQGGASMAIYGATRAVTAAGDNGGGITQLTVASTANFSTGEVKHIGACSFSSTITSKIDNGSGSLGSTLTVTAASDPSLMIGNTITGTGVASGTFISAFGTGIGNTGTYTVATSALAISSLTWAASTVTATTVAPHGITNGNTFTVTVTGATPSGYNVTSVTATSTGASTFTYPLVSNPGLETVPGSYTVTQQNVSSETMRNGVANGQWQIAVVDSTHVTLTGSSYNSETCGSGTITGESIISASNVDGIVTYFGSVIEIHDITVRSAFNGVNLLWGSKAYLSNVTLGGGGINPAGAHVLLGNAAHMECLDSTGIIIAGSALIAVQVGAAGTLSFSNCNINISGNSASYSYSDGFVLASGSGANASFSNTPITKNGNTITGPRFQVSNAATITSLNGNDTAKTFFPGNSAGKITLFGQYDQQGGNGPTQQSFASHVTNQTYTTPTNPTPLWIRVRLCGAGGGGGGGAGSLTGGGNGGNPAASSCFGTNATACSSPLVSANPGSGGGGGGSGGNLGNPGTAGAGGTVGVSNQIAIVGNAGAPSFPPPATGVSIGANGGPGPFGGAGQGGLYGSAGSPGTSCGGGGGGGSNSNVGGDASGGGGGGGGYSELAISNPAASYTYTVGQGGTAGTAGTGGTGPGAGGAGGDGLIIVDEYYQ